MAFLSALNIATSSGISNFWAMSSAHGFLSALALAYHGPGIFYVRQQLKMMLSAAPAANFQNLLTTLSASDAFTLPQAISSALGGELIQYASTSWEIYLDGRPLSARITDASISYDEGSVHNSIVIASTDPELFVWANPAVLYGEARIEARIGTRVMFFLVDLRDGDELNFTISGISVSAKEDFPHAADVSLSLDAPELASSICGRIVSSCPVVWECGDFLVPVTFTFSGPPLACIVALAAEIGAIVRCNDAGELVVRKKRPVRPVNMDSAAVAVDYASADLISLSAREDQESGYTGVEVIGRPMDIWMPLLRLEEASPIKGDRVFIDVFWQGRPPSVSETYVTDGEIVLCGRGVFYTMESVEVVDFKDGVGSVSLPVDEIISVAWIGDSGSGIIAPVNGQELMIEDNAFRVATVKYRSTYQRYFLDNHFVERLIAVLFLQSAPGVWVRVLTDGDSVLGPAISAPMLSSDAAATERATAWIDANKYRKSIVSVSAPYQDAAVDGALAHVNDDYIGAPGNYHIVSSRIQIAGVGVNNVLELEKCLISFNS